MRPLYGDAADIQARQAEKEQLARSVESLSFRDEVIRRCKEKAAGYRESAEGNLARETWIDRAEVMESFARELESL